VNDGWLKNPEPRYHAYDHQSQNTDGQFDFPASLPFAALGQIAAARAGNFDLGHDDAAGAMKCKVFIRPLAG
jgi:hypothetical protein